MPKIDIPIKRLMQERPMDWIEYLLPEHSEKHFSEFKQNLVPKAESRTDAIWQIGTGEESFYLHFEPQGYQDHAFPARMLRYRADLWEYTLSNGLGAPSICQIALFIFPGNENKENCLIDQWDKREGIKYYYRGLLAWELDKEPILQKKLIALYPLLPLMKEEPGEKPEQIMERTIKAIEEVEDVPLRSDLYVAVSILAERRYTATLIRKFIRREMLMESELLKEWTAEERKEATEKATINVLKSNILDLLEEKFGIVHGGIKDKLQKIQDPDVLRYLSKKIIKAETIEEFEEFLDKC